MARRWIGPGKLEVSSGMITSCTYGRVLLVKYANIAMLLHISCVVASFEANYEVADIIHSHACGLSFLHFERR